MNCNKVGFRLGVGLLGAAALLIAAAAFAQEDRVADLNNQCAQLYRQGKYSEATPIAEEAARLAEATFGAESDPTLAVALNNLGELYRVQGKYEEAEPLMKRALDIDEEALGPEDPGVARDLNNLAALNQNRGRYKETEPLLKRALDIDEKALGPEDPDVARELNTLGTLYFDQGRYSEAEPLLKRALDIDEKALGSEHPDVANRLNNLATVYQFQGKYAEAEPLLKRALEIDEKALGSEHPDVATAMSNLAAIYQSQGKYAGAEPLLKRALEIDEKALGPEHPDLATRLNNLAAVYGFQGKYAEAEPLLKRALDIDERALGPEHAEVARNLSNLGELYRVQGKYAEAKPLLKRALEIDEKALGPGHVDVARDTTDLAAIYEDEGSYAKAEPLIKRALEIYAKALGPEHPNVATALNNLAELYLQESRYGEAEPLLKRALEIDEKALGFEHPDVARDIVNLAGLYDDQARYAEAEPLYKRALDIDEKSLGSQHTDVATVLSNLASFYEGQGKYEQAEPLLKRALDIDEKAFGPDHPDVAKQLNNLASLYYQEGKYAEAELLLQRALAIDERTLGPEHPDVAMQLNGLVMLYYSQDRYAEAQPLIKRALAIDEKTLGSEHPEVARDLNSLGVLYEVQGEYGAAEPLIKRALEIDGKIFGLEHPNVATDLNNLAMLYFLQGSYAEAEPLLQRALVIDEKAVGPNADLATILNQLALVYYAWEQPIRAAKLFDRNLHMLQEILADQLAYMSERERLQFLETVRDQLTAYFSFITSYYSKYPELVGQIYDVLLWRKGMVAASITSLRAKLASGGDPRASVLLNEIAEKRAQVVRMLASLPVDRTQLAQARDRIAQVQEQKDSLERELAKQSAVFAQEITASPSTWQQVRDVLRPGEAAVEVVRFEFYNGKKWTAEVRYAALIVTPETKVSPSFVLLGDAKDLECGPLNDYARIAGIRLPCKVQQPDGLVRSPTTPNFYEAFWKPLEQPLGNARRIYFSPDGVLNQLSLAVVSDERGQLLLEKYDLRILDSTRDLLRKSRPYLDKTAVLVGAPAFELDETQQLAAARQVAYSQADSGSERSAGWTSGYGLDALRGRPFDPYDDDEKQVEEAMLQEVQRLNTYLKDKHWTTALYTKEKAVVEVVETVHHPRVLHLATHGEFAQDPMVTPKLSGTLSTGQDLLDDPMLRSGLFFAGANRFRRHEPAPEGMHDGVLTAYEAMALDLEGTELVVLSACDTGLGSMRDGEGVFGLRRALQEAGANAVLMSMWKVPSKATQELMQLFYEKWLSGEDKAGALQHAQMDLRQKLLKENGYDDPHLWGAFVLVGK